MIFERCRVCSLIFQNSPRHVNSAFNPILLSTGNFNSLIPRIPRSINFPGSGTKNIKRFFLCPLLRANENSQLPPEEIPFHIGIRIERRDRLLRTRTDPPSFEAGDSIFKRLR